MSSRPPRNRRIVVFDEDGKSRALMDGIPPNATFDLSRPGYVSTRYWATDQAPSILTRPDGEPSVPDTLEPPPGGAICRVITFPPDSTFIDTVSPESVKAYFEAVGAPHASSYGPDAPHPYMQKTATLDVCMVIAGEITLVLDAEDVDLRAGDIVVQRGTNHAWSNRSNETCVVVFSSHDARN